MPRFVLVLWKGVLAAVFIAIWGFLSFYVKAYESGFADDPEEAILIAVVFAWAVTLLSFLFRLTRFWLFGLRQLEWNDEGVELSWQNAKTTRLKWEEIRKTTHRRWRGNWVFESVDGDFRVRKDGITGREWREFSLAVTEKAAATSGRKFSKRILSWLMS